jgi:GrpB-like predicted nucleotidyltransferase (UPF0157 family)
VTDEHPPVTVDPDPRWPELGAALLRDVTNALTALPGHDAFRYDHIGSTSVPGLAAKPILDLMVRMPSLPDEGALVPALAPLGFRIAVGSRPDSPGVRSDLPRPGMDPDPALYRKLLCYRPSGTAMEAILHIRRADSPFGAFVLAFRDRLREDPDAAARYAALKRGLATRFADAPDYDDYTRAKTVFIDEVAASGRRKSRGGPSSRRT